MPKQNFLLGSDQVSTAAHVTLSVAMAFIAAGLLWTLSPALSIVFAIATFMVTLVCPMWMVSVHKFKAKINGPWDEAVPHLPSMIGTF